MKKVITRVESAAVGFGDEEDDTSQVAGRRGTGARARDIVMSG